MELELWTPPVGGRIELKKNFLLGSCTGVISYQLSNKRARSVNP
jgi:hypothetical protein